MMAYTLRYGNELRDQSEYFRNIKQPPIDADSLQLAETLISKMSAKLDISKFEDGYEVAVKALVEAKIKNMALPIEEAPRQRPSNVINLMEALRKSLGADARSAKKPPKSEREARSQRHRTGQRADQARNKTQIGLRTKWKRDWVWF